VGTNTKERMSISKISGVVVWQLVHDVSRDFELGMECVLSLEQWNVFCHENNNCCFVRIPKVLGIEGMLQNSDVWTS
jgi:hypothetical protein